MEVGNHMDVNDFTKKYAYKQDETKYGHDFWRDLIELVGCHDDYETYVPQCPVVHTEVDKNTKAVLTDSTGFVDFYSEKYGVVVELKGGDKSIASTRDEFQPGPAGDAEWEAVCEPRPRAWDRDRCVTPYAQAKEYADDLMAVGKSVNYIVVSNFREIRIYTYVNFGHGRVRDTEEVIALSEVPDKLHRLQFLTCVDPRRVSEKEAVSRHAGELMARLRDHVERCWDADGVSELDESRRASLDLFLLRIAFLLFAEDSLLLGNGKVGSGHEFVDWVESHDARYLNTAFNRLFEALDTPGGERTRNQAAIGFPYINGSLFSCDPEFLASYGIGSVLLLPAFDEELKSFLVEEVSKKTDWHEVDPTVFGSIFECLVGADFDGKSKRRLQGMHYTSVANIHKVIDPLFLNRLEDAYDAALDEPDVGARREMLRAIKVEISNMRFLDPACGSGNFLVEVYKCLRDLDNRVVKAYADILPEGEVPSKWWLTVGVKTSSFYGIEYDPLAGAIARTSLHMMCLAMNAQSEKSDMYTRNFPLDKDVCSHIYIGVNAISDGETLRDWARDFTNGYVDYIIGNPPYAGAWNLDDAQKRDRELVFGKRGKVLDYVSCWFELASRYIEASGGHTKAAFVATNSVCQGQQVNPLWRQILVGRDQEIGFAWRSFKWYSESTEGVAAVTVVVVGFGVSDGLPKSIMHADGSPIEMVPHINAWLLGLPDIWVEPRMKPICREAKPILTGYVPADDDTLTFGKDVYDDFVRYEPQSMRYVKRVTGTDELLRGKDHWCFWLPGADLDDLKANHPMVWDAVERCKAARMLMDKPKSIGRLLRDTPHLMRCANTTPLSCSYLAIPQIWGEKRRYTPLVFLTDDTIPTNLLYFINDAGLYEFGVLSSIVHNAFMRVLCGGLETRPRYNIKLVYNNFPWPNCDAAARARIEEAASAVLEARANHADSTLVRMYDGISPMPRNCGKGGDKKYDLREYDDLRRAHEVLDAAVEAAYGVTFGDDEGDIVRHLLELSMKVAG